MFSSTASWFIRCVILSLDVVVAFVSLQEGKGGAEGDAEVRTRSSFLEDHCRMIAWHPDLLCIVKCAEAAE
jgi:hypothetical protein